MSDPLVDLAMQQIAAGDLAAAENAINVFEDIADMEEPAGRCMLLKLRGRVALRMHDWVSAFDYFSAAMGEQPDDIDCHLCIGMAQFEMGWFDKAADAFREVIARNGWVAKAWLKLGGCHALMQHHAEAWACLERAVGIAPDDPECQHAMGIMCSSLGVEEGALHHFREALKLRPDYAHAEAGLAFTLLRMGEWERGWPHFEARWRIPSPVSPWNYHGHPLYQGDLEGLRGKRVLLRSEQGFGDSIQFSRYVQPLAEIASAVFVETQSELERLFQCLPATISVRVRDAIPDFDAQTSLMSLPLLFGTTKDNVPPPTLIRAIPNRIGARVGLCWAGGARPQDPMANAVDARRSLTMTQMFPIMDVLGDGYLNLQWESLKVSPLMAVADWQDTADLVGGLELVITADTAMAHLAASLGVETWLLNRFDSCWRWGMLGDRTPWYADMRIFRQPRLGAWEPVIAEVAKALKAWL